jgi:hypothetical protein
VVSVFGEVSITSKHHIYIYIYIYIQIDVVSLLGFYICIFSIFSTLALVSHRTAPRLLSLSLSLSLSLANQSNFLFHQPRSFVEFSDPHLQVRLYVWIQSAVLIVTEARRDRARGEQQRVAW